MRANEDFRPEHVRDWVVVADEGLAVIDKPSGLLSQPDSSGEPDLVTLARSHFGDLKLGVLHRLDRNVSGLVLLSRTAEVARWLSPQFAAGTIERDYLAICRGKPEQDALTIEVPLVKDERANLVRVATIDEPGAQAARTEVEVLRRAQGLTGKLVLLRARPISGRSHQLRVHLAHAGLPILGDPKYGLRARGLTRPLLHATAIRYFDARTGAYVSHRREPPFRLEEAVLLPRAR
jgi:23S rRNA pseudouridine1911/1915/1917 synthase